jgi:ankyrin repeat protein
MDVSLRFKPHGLTSLHWAAGWAQLDTVKLLLERNAPVEAKDETWGATPLSWALFGWKNPPTEITQERYYQVVALLVAAGATVKLEGLTEERVRSCSRPFRARGRLRRIFRPASSS